MPAARSTPQQLNPDTKQGQKTLTGGKISANLLNHKTLATFF